MKSYDYQQRTGVEEISWDRFVALSRELAEKLSQGEITMVVGIARAGLLPATAIACMLRKELYPVRATRRWRDQVVSAAPVWKVDLPANSVEGEVVAVVDEMADSGETLALVAKRVESLGARRVVTAALVSHSWASPRPDYIGLETDAFVIFPWDASVYQDGAWGMHPEIAQGLKLQDSKR